MIQLSGTFNTAKVFTDNIDDKVREQIIELCNQEMTQGSRIRVMPDTHAGKGSTIGTTMTVGDKIVPNIVGVDIGCGMIVAKLNVASKDLDFKQLDKVIRKHVPSGFHIRKSAHALTSQARIDEVHAPINRDRAKKSIGTLGGGNHFIEVNVGKDDTVYLVIHSGSRNLGKQIAEHYQNLAYERLVAKKQAAGESTKDVRKDLAYLEGKNYDMYMHDMKIAQEYANLNRRAMLQEITTHMNWEVIEDWESIHNFIDMETKILRKGATSAEAGQKVLVPLNMRDGSIIAIGKGNPDWNYSAPHGAGRLMSRTQAKKRIRLSDFKETMKNIWTTSVNKSTIDESPFVYKPMEEIIKHTEDTMEIVDIVKPVYNFKSN